MKNFGLAIYLGHIVIKASEENMFCLWRFCEQFFVAGIYLEDLFIMPEYRGNGYGKAVVKELARIAVERKCAVTNFVRC